MSFELYAPELTASSHATGHIEGSARPFFLRPCPFCGCEDIAAKGLSDSAEDEFTFILRAGETQPTPPPGGWPEETWRPMCNGCGAYGPRGYVLSADEQRVLHGPTWNDRAASGTVNETA